MAAAPTASVSLASLLLRVVLGVTFLWAGINKTFYDMPVTGAAALTLHTYGVIDGPAAPPAVPVPSAINAAPGAAYTFVLAQDDAATSPAPTSPAPTSQASAEEAAEAVKAQLQYAAEDFAQPINVARVNNLILLMDARVQQGYWPSQLASPLVMRAMAWSAALVELVGGACIIIGLFTRFWALSFVGIMGVALWQTQISPAMIATAADPDNAKTLFGFLPDPRFDLPTLSTEAWAKFLWQLMIGAGSLAVLLIGSGALSLDRALFTGKKKPAAPESSQSSGE